MLSFLLITISIFSSFVSSKWTYSTLLSYVYNNKLSVNPDNRPYFLIDTANYIKEKEEKEFILNRLSSIKKKYNINIIFIILDTITKPFGDLTPLNSFAANFTKEYYQDDILKDYMVILYSITDEEHVIVAGEDAKDIYSDWLIENYIYYTQFNSKNYFKSMKKLLNFINDKKRILYGLWFVIICFIIIFICIVLVISSCVYTMYFKNRQYKIWKINKMLYLIFHNKKGKDIFNDYCIYCLDDFYNIQMNNDLEIGIKYELLYQGKEPSQETLQISNNPNENDSVNEMNKCNHLLHKECREKWKKITKMNCPLCHEKIDECKNTNEDLLKVAKALYNTQVTKCPWIKNYSLSKFGVKLSKTE